MKSATPLSRMGNTELPLDIITEVGHTLRQESCPVEGKSLRLIFRLDAAGVREMALSVAPAFAHSTHFAKAVPQRQAARWNFAQVKRAGHRVAAESQACAGLFVLNPTGFPRRTWRAEKTHEI